MMSTEKGEEPAWFLASWAKVLLYPSMAYSGFKLEKKVPGAFHQLPSLKRGLVSLAGPDLAVTRPSRVRGITFLVNILEAKRIVTDGFEVYEFDRLDPNSLKSQTGFLAKILYYFLYLAGRPNRTGHQKTSQRCVNIA